MVRLIRNKQSRSKFTLIELQFPVMLKVMTDEETKEYHLKKFAEWGKKWEQKVKGELVFGVDGNIYRNGKLLAEKPKLEENEWYERRMKGSARSWDVWDKK